VLTCSTWDLPQLSRGLLAHEGCPNGASRADVTPAEVLAPAHTDWLYHRLWVAKNPAGVAAFRETAAGTVIPGQPSLG
jgi:hypothetical protein